MSSSTTSPAKATRSKATKPNGSTARPTAVEQTSAAASASPSYEEIAKRAYEIYEREGRQDGTELQNWLRAEAELSGIKGH